MQTYPYMTPRCEVIEIHAEQVLAASEFSLDNGGSLDGIFDEVK